MKTTELQIGDLVYCTEYPDVPCRVYALSNPYPRADRFNDTATVDLWTGDGFVTVDIDSIQPIPLTTEILEKNGFVSIDNGCKYVQKWNMGEYIYADMSFDCNVEVDILNGTSSFLHIRVPHIGILGIPLYYVYQFQHALRLCGLDALADNFQL